MGKIQLSGGFTPVSEGEHTFYISKVDYNEAFGKLQITCETEDKQKHIERFILLDSKGNTIAPAVTSLTFFARAAMGDDALTEIDPEDMVGHYFGATVVHQTVPRRDDPTKTMTFVKLEDKHSVSGIGVSEPVSGGLDLDDLLGRYSYDG